MVDLKKLLLPTPGESVSCTIANGPGAAGRHRWQIGKESHEHTESRRRAELYLERPGGEHATRGTQRTSGRAAEAAGGARLSAGAVLPAGIRATRRSSGGHPEHSGHRAPSLYGQG